ncbi:serine hydrolase domain-containing protein [Radicibacter daui]|uniref:serine hydrolase domain-containing protein n=1 Tax=Radicibacter daui TaxID=3064829 RepID=UPI004046E82E
MDKQNWPLAVQVAADFAAEWKADAPGGAIVAFDASGIRFAHAGGLESLATRAPFTPASVVRYASVTKHVFCAMVLAHPTLIGLEDRLGKHLPELSEPLASVTVGRALNMTGGLPDVRECLTLLGLSVYSHTDAEALLKYLARLTRLNFEAGTEISYSNTGYRLVEAALESKGVRFDDWVQKVISGPLRIAMKAPDVWDDAVPGLVPGYWHSGEKWQLAAAGLHISASGSLTGSAEALAKWLKALVAGNGLLNGRFPALSARRTLKDGRPTGYGLGLRRSLLGGRELLGHGGSHPGYKTHFLIEPESGAGVVVVTNREDTNTYKMALGTMAALLDEPLPATSDILGEGTWVSESGPWWITVKGSAVNYIDSEDMLYADGEGWVSSRSPTAPLRLRRDGDALVGEVGHVVRRFLPAAGGKVPATLSGRWESPEGAVFDIVDGALIQGIGPCRQVMPLEALGGGRYLYTLVDGPWRKRVCLHQLAADRVELVLSRARMIEYTRAR